MARAPVSGKAGALIKFPAPLVKAVLTLGVVGSTLGASLFVASVTGATHVGIPSLAGSLTLVQHSQVPCDPDVSQ